MGDSEEGDQAIQTVLDYMGNVEQSGANVDERDLRKYEKKQKKYKKHNLRKAKRNKMLGKVLPKGVKKMILPGIKEGSNKRSGRFFEKTTDVLDEQSSIDRERDELATTGDNEESYQQAREALAQLMGWDLTEKEGEVNEEAFKIDSVLKRFGRAKVGTT